MLKFCKQNKTILIAVLLYFFLFSFLSIARHYTFQTQVWDLAAFEQSFWNTINGRIMFNNFEGTNHLAIHFSPFLFLLVPFYFLWPGPEILLILQSLAISLAVLPIYLLSKKLLNKKWALTVSAIYLLYPSLHWANLFDFHAVTFAIPLFAAFFYFWHQQKIPWALTILILAMTTAENMIVAGFFVGIFIILNKHYKLGFLVSLGSLIYFIVVAKIIMPALGGGIVRLDRYEQFGDSALEIIKNVIIRPDLTAQTVLIPEKMAYLFNILLSASFLPFAAGKSLILLVPGLLINLLTTFSFQFSNFYQYDSILIPFMMIGAVFGLKNILTKTKINKNYVMTFISLTVALGFIFNSPLSPLNFPLPKFQDERVSDFKKIIKLIPPDASVAAYTNLAPHLTHREEIYMTGDEPYFMDYVILDKRDIFGFDSQEIFDDYLRQYAANNQHEAVIIDDRYIILKPRAGQ